MTVNVIAFDLSLTATGVCYSDGSTDLLAPKKLSGLTRLAWLRDEILERCEVPGGPADEADLIVLEGYSLGTTRAASHAHSAGELGGLIRFALWSESYRFAILPPASLKKFATGKGNATKPDMRAERFKRTGDDERDDNRNDAWWLRQAGLSWFASRTTSPLDMPPDLLRMPALNATALAAMEELTRDPLEALAR